MGRKKRRDGNRTLSFHFSFARASSKFPPNLPKVTKYTDGRSEAAPILLCSHPSGFRRTHLSLLLCVVESHSTLDNTTSTKRYQISCMASHLRKFISMAAVLLELSYPHPIQHGGQACRQCLLILTNLYLFSLLSLQGDPGLESVWQWYSNQSAFNKTVPKPVGSGSHVVTGPIHVCGAEAGDIIQVRHAAVVP